MLPLLLLLACQDVELPETVVRAPRSYDTVTTNAAKVTVLTGADLQRSGEDSLPRAIGALAGIWVQETNYGGGAPVIRGLLGNQVLILVDGVRLNDATTRFGPNQSLNNIDPAIVDRVEILRGSASVKYGSDAIGGVISIWTKRRPAQSQDREDHYKLVEGAFDGTYDGSVEGGLASLTLESSRGDHGGLLIGSGHYFGDLQTAENETVPFTGYIGHSFFGAYEYALGERRTLRVTARANRDFDVPRTDRLIVEYGQTQPNSEVWHYSLQDRRGYLVSYTDDAPGEYVDAFQVRANFHSYTEQRNRVSTGSSTRRFEEDETRTVGVGLDWRKLVGEDHLLTWGVDASFDDVDSTRRDLVVGSPPAVKAGAFAPGSEYLRAGVFVQDELLAFDPWYVTAGLRFSSFAFSFHEFGTGTGHTGDFNALTASLEVARELGEGVRGTATLAQGFRAPNLDDLANDGSFAGGDELANPDLDPEQSLMAELALEVTRPRWSATAALFATRIDDWVGRTLVDAGDPNVTGDETWMRANTGTVDLVGVELGGRVRLGEASPFSLSTIASYVRGRQDDPQLGDGLAAQRVPPLNGRFGLDYDPEEPFYQVGFARVYAIWADDQSRLHPNDVADPRINPDGTPGWTTWNVDFGGSLNADSDWWAGVRNLSDKHYRVHASGVDAPGVHLVIGVHVSF